MRDWGFIAGLCLARVAFGFQYQSLASLGPELVTTFHLEYATLGTLVGLYMLPGIFVALPGGLVGRRFGARLVVGAGLGLMAMGALVGAALFGPGGIGLGRVVSGRGGRLLRTRRAEDRVEPAPRSVGGGVGQVRRPGG